MTNWLQQASEVLRRGSKQPPVEYHLNCVCGRPFDGFRTKVSQRLVCQWCSNTLFVLPVSAYPRPKQRPAEALVVRQAAGTKGQKKKSAPLPPQPSAAAVWADRTGRQFTAAGRWLRRQFTPLRIVILCMGLVVVATGFWMVHLRSLDRARQILTDVVPRAKEALQQPDFITAAERLEAVVAALDLLGRDDAEARGLRQMRIEAVAASRLAPGSVFDLVQEALQAEKSASGLDWADAFRHTYLDSWLVLDSNALQADAAAGLQVDLALVVKGHPVQLAADLKPLQRFLVDGAPRRVIFAAQLADCRPAATGDGWEVVLQPGTAFLWSSGETLRNLGVPVDESTAQVLATQSRLLGLSP